MNYKKPDYVKLVLELILILLLVLFVAYDVYAENQLFVTASSLNGRAAPNKTSRIEAIFERGDQLEATGRVSGSWIEVYGGETGTVWCSADYLSEAAGSRMYTNTSGGRVRIRKSPDGSAIGWISAGKTVEVIRISNGWGYIPSTGWVKLCYFSSNP